MRLSRPIPSGTKASPLLRVQGGCKIAGRPGAMVHPQRDSPAFVWGKLANRKLRRNRKMGRFGSALAKARPSTSSDVRLLTPLARPSAGPLQAHENAPAALTSVEQKIGRLVGRDRKSQLGVGRYDGWTSHLSAASEDFRNFPKARLAAPRRAGIQFGNATEQLSRGIRTQSRACRPGSDQTREVPVAPGATQLPRRPLPTRGHSGPELATRGRKSPASTRPPPATVRAFARGSVGPPATHPCLARGSR